MMQFFVAYTGINCEFVAQKELQAKAFEVYCPIARKTVRHARRQEIRTVPVFSRYLFVKFDLEQPEWNEAIRSTYGIIDVLANNWEPIAVSDSIITEIKQREDAGDFNQIIPARNNIKPRWHKSFEILKNLLNQATVTV